MVSLTIGLSTDIQRSKCPCRICSRGRALCSRIRRDPRPCQSQRLGYSCWPQGNMGPAVVKVAFEPLPRNCLDRLKRLDHLQFAQARQLNLIRQA